MRSAKLGKSSNQHTIASLLYKPNNTDAYISYNSYDYNLRSKNVLK